MMNQMEQMNYKELQHYKDLYYLNKVYKYVYKILSIIKYSCRLSYQNVR